MALDEIVLKIPNVLRDTAADKLIDLVLNSKDGEKLPSDLAKTILFYWQRDQLPSETGLRRLLEAAMIVAPSETVKLFEDLGVSEVVPLLTELKT
jgi:hypothetical protein